MATPTVFEPLSSGELPTLETERLVIRHPRPEDADDLLTVFGDEEVMRYWSHEPLVTRSAVTSYIESIDSLFHNRELFQWAIQHRGEHRVIGTVTLHELMEQNRRAEVGFILGREHWGRGLATEAVRSLCRFAFDQLGLHRLEADIDPRNTASEKLLVRLGFGKEGLLRERWYTYGEWSDSALYGLLSSEFEHSTG